MKFQLKIEPAITPRTQHQIRALLQTNGYDITGGGTVKNGAFCYVLFERPDPRDKDTDDSKEYLICPQCGHYPLSVIGKRKGLDLKITGPLTQCPVCIHEE